MRAIAGFGWWLRLPAVLGMGLMLGACWPATETYMRPTAPGGELFAVNCTGTGQGIAFDLPNETALSLRASYLSSAWLDLKLSAYKTKRSTHASEAGQQASDKTIEITAQEDIVVEWENTRLPVRFGNAKFKPGAYVLDKHSSDGQSIRIKNFAGDWALVTLPALSVDGTEFSLPPIRLERRTTPTLMSINC